MVGCTALRYLALDTDRLRTERLRHTLEYGNNVIGRSRIADNEHFVAGLQVAHLDVHRLHDNDQVGFQSGRNVR